MDPNIWSKIAPQLKEFFVSDNGSISDNVDIVLIVLSY